MTQDRQPWHDAWRDLQFLRGKLYDRVEAIEADRASWPEPEFNPTEADKIRARSWGIIL